MNGVVPGRYPFRNALILALVVAFLLFSVGSFWAFQRGGSDFNVFYGAWRLALEGRGAAVFQETPDRFLYAPGFAWLLSPLGLLPRDASLALWCLLKSLALGAVAVALGRKIESIRPRFGLATAFGAFLLLARPFLIDFQYGQVNSFILAACCWALLEHFNERKPSVLRDGVSWMVLAFAAVGKVFPLPLLLLPWLPSSVPGSRKRALYERLGTIVGISLTVVAPFLFLGWEGGLTIHAEWKDALFSRGFPIESHNQSFMAFLQHYLSGQSTPVLAEGGRAVPMGAALLSDAAIRTISMGWTLLGAVALLAWLWSSQRRLGANRFGAYELLRWLAIVVGLLIVPSHLVWKPYFVFGMPLAILALTNLRWPALVVLFAWINLTGFDFLGHDLASRIEGGSFLLWSHLFLLGAAWVFKAPRRGAGSPLPAVGQR